MPEPDLTPAGRARLREICDSVPPPPWEYRCGNVVALNEDGANFINASRSALPAALDKIDRLERIIRELGEYSDQLPGGPDRTAFQTLVEAARAAQEESDG